MKKFLGIVVIIIIFFIIYFLQSNFFTFFNIAGVKPNLFIILVLILGLFLGKGIGFTLGVVFGLLLDIYVGKTLGMYALSLGIIGCLSGYLDINFQKESRINLIWMTILTTSIFELINNIGMNIFSTSFLKILLLETLFNVLIVIIIYNSLLKFGEFISNMIKGEKTLFKYY